MIFLPTERHLREFTGDIFNYKDLSKKLLDDVLLKMELPNSFGLYGNWGSGKSTMIHYILKHIINDPTAYSAVKVVYFEPWKYEYSDQKDLLFALLTCIKKVSKARLKWKTLLTNALVIASGVSRNLIGYNALKPIEYIEKDFKFFENKIYSDQELWIDKVEKFRKDFDSIIKKVLQKEHASKLIIFIDDLDRCLPENSVKLLEGIKNFLSIDNTLFVLAIDKRIIGEMIEKKYDLHDGYGDEYLTKIIQYYYDLPKSDIEPLIKEILLSYNIEFDNKELKYISFFLKNFGSEPRIAKHYLHQFCMSLTLSMRAKELLKNNNEKVYLQFLFVASYLLTRYPKLFSPGDNKSILNYIRRCVSVKNDHNQEDMYSRMVAQDNSINDQDRKKLEEIMQYPINTGRESSPPTIMDFEKLSIALQCIKSI